jgi:hypothetical protein
MSELQDAEISEEDQIKLEIKGLIEQDIDRFKEDRTKLDDQYYKIWSIYRNFIRPYKVPGHPYDDPIYKIPNETKERENKFYDILEIYETLMIARGKRARLCQQVLSYLDYLPKNYSQESKDWQIRHALSDHLETAFTDTWDVFLVNFKIALQDYFETDESIYLFEEFKHKVANFG